MPFRKIKTKNTTDTPTTIIFIQLLFRMFWEGMEILPYNM